MNAPPAVSNLFLSSDGAAPPLRVGLLIDERGIPGYARGIIEDLRLANYVDIALVGVTSGATNASSAAPESGLVLRAYATFIEPRYQMHPDPLVSVSCEDLLTDVPRVSLHIERRGDSCTLSSAGLAAIATAQLDVIIDLSGRPVRQVLLPATRHGVWRYHFGDRRLYPAGSGFLREIIDGMPLTGIELTRLGSSDGDDVTLLRALFRTVPFPSRQANRFAPIWGTRHFVAQSLWSLRHGSRDAPATLGPGLTPRNSGGRVPTVGQFARWMLGEVGGRVFPLFRHVDRPLHWRIAIRRARVPLYEDSSRPALQSFRWVDSPPSCHWADPVIFEREGQTWLFFEETVDPSRVGHICCGRLTPDGDLVDVRAVLQQPHHLSFPQIIAADAEVFMLPEGAQGGGVDLYRARRFPDEWVLEKRLLDFRCVDSSVFRASGSWWMMTSPQVVPGHAPITWLLRAERLTGPWEFQPSGVVASDVRVARGAGSVFERSGRLIRPSQDCSVSYGHALVINEIVSLHEPQYRERTICRVEPGWMPRLAGVHSYSRIGEWEAIDGGFTL